MTDAIAIAPYALTGNFVPVTVDTLTANDNSLPGDVRMQTLTLDDHNEADPSHRIYAQVTIYQSTHPHGGEAAAELDRAMHEHNPPLERHLIPIGNHYEVAYLTRHDWNRYQETYTQLLAAQGQGVRSHSLTADLGVPQAPNPLFRSAQVFNSVMFVNDFDVPTAALRHLQRVDVAIPGRDGTNFDSRGFVATNPAAEEFLKSRGYVQVDTRQEGGRACPFFLPPLDAQLYQQTATI